jgi:Glycosyl transferases group 1
VRASTSPIVFVTDEVPRPGEAGHLAVNHAILNFLTAHGLSVVVILVRPRLPWPIQSFGGALNPALVRVEGPKLISGSGWVAATPRPTAGILARRVLNALPAALSEGLRRRARAGDYGEVDAVIGRFMEPSAINWAASRIAALKPRAVLVDTIFRAPLLRHPTLVDVHSVLITHDVFHRRHNALAARGLRLFPTNLGQAEELDLLRLANVVVAIQPEEEMLLRELLPGRKVISAPMMAQPRPRPPGVEREAGLFAFVGSDSVHNVEGLRWFLAEVWPHLRATLPTARLEVCGSVGHALGLRAIPNGVLLQGLVPDLGTVLHRAAIAVAPILAGSGLKIKLLDYVAHGLGTVTTPVGVEGFEVTRDWPFTVAVDAEEFAQAAARLAADIVDAAAREKRALDYCRLYAPERVFSPLAEAVGQNVCPGDKSK